MIGYLGIVERLLDAGADPNAQDEAESLTAISWAAESGHEDVVKLLLERGADPNVDDRILLSALSGCEPDDYDDNDALIEMLVKHGADVFMDCWSDERPLVIAARQDRHLTVELFLEASYSSRSVRQEHIWDAITVAAEEGHEAILASLMRHYEPDETEKQTPWEWAKEYQFGQSYELLRPYSELEARTDNGYYTVRRYVDPKLESHQEIEGESDGDQLRSLQVKEDKDADGPCDYCRSIDEVCSVDMEKRRQKPFYFVSEEEYRLLRELCSNCFPDEELTIPNLRRLIDENKKPAFKTQTYVSTPTMSLIEVSAEASILDCGDEAIDQGEVLLHDVEEAQTEEEEILLPEIVNLHHDLGCLLADAHGEYRYMGAESGASFNSAVRSWMLRMGAGARSKEKDRDKIPGMLKVSPPSVKSPLTDAASSPGNPCQFPSQDLLSACAARFFEQVHCLYWIYSAESFYTRLETTHSGDVGQITASWLCSLHSIVALCASCEPSPNGLVNGQRAHDSLEMAKSLVTRVCDEADLDSIRALIVLSLAFHSNGFTNSAYLHIGLAVRIAFSLGLHLDKYSTKSGVVSQAHARRLWWTLYLVDQDLSLALGKPGMNSPPNETSWKPPLPSEFVVSPGSHTPNGYLEQCIRLAQITQSIRQNLYDGPVHGGQKLSNTHFNDAMAALQSWLDHVPPHLHLSPSISLSYRRSVSLLHLRYWSAMMLVTKPFLLCNLLQGIEHVESAKRPIFATLAKTCVSAAESTFEILETMVLHKVASSLVMADYLFALQALQVIVAACGLYHMDGHQARAKQCLRILLAISVSGYPKHLIPETLFQLQQCGLAEGVEETSNIALQPSEPLGYPQMVTEPMQRISLDHSTDQLAM
ncbi:hypothetical protein DER44DRAFT_692412, partial [Fusarium oxysporum]